MADARVDKSWQAKGLGAFGSEAIFGTLNHYGVAASEAAYRALAAEKFPLAIAEGWQKSWKGTGPFARFPVAAAEELWSRLEGDRLAPVKVAEALAALMAALSKMIDGAPDAPVGKTFAAFDALKPRIPLADGKVRRDFVLEIATYLGKALEAFNHVVDALAKEGHLDDAQSFAEVEEFLFPERAGVVIAGLRAARGEKAEAIADLEKLAADAARGGEGRLTAIDALISLEALEPAAKLAEPLLDELEKAGELHLAFDVARRLGYSLEKRGRTAELKKLATRIEALGARHQAEHQH